MLETASMRLRRFSAGFFIFEKQKIVQTTSSLILQLFGRLMQMMLFVKDARGLSNSTNNLDGILLSRHCYLKLSLIIGSIHFPVTVFQSSNCTAIAMYFNFSEKLKFTRVYVLFHKFFLFFFNMNHNWRGRLSKLKRSMSTKESKTTLVLEIRSPQIKELVRNGGIIVDFNGVRETLFNHQSRKYHQI